MGRGSARPVGQAGKFSLDRTPRYLGLFVLALLLASCGDRWNRSFEPDEDGPHGTLMLTRFLQVARPDATYIELPRTGLLELDTLSSEHDLYVAIGEGLPYNTSEVQRLAAFVRAGGTALLNAEEVSIELTRELVADGCLTEAEFALFASSGFRKGDTVFAYTSQQARVPVRAVVFREEGYEALAFSILPTLCYPRARPLIAMQRVGNSFGVHGLDLYPTRELPEGEPFGELESTTLEDGGVGFAEAPPSDGIPAEDPPTAEQDGEQSSADDDSEYFDDSEAYYEEEPEVTAELPIEPPTDAELASFPGAPIEGAYPVFVDLPYGEGRLLLHTAPIMLTNAYLADPVGRPYVEAITTYLPTDLDTIHFDTERRASAQLIALLNQPPAEDNDGESRDSESVLRELLARGPLRAAWFMLLAASLTFVLLGARRRQRAVPVIQPRRNTTLDYLGSVSRLYLSRPDNRRMAEKELAMFEAYCLRKLGLRPLQDEADLQKLLAVKGVDRGRVESLQRYASSVRGRKPLSNDSYIQLLTILRAVYSGLGRRRAMRT